MTTKASEQLVEAAQNTVTSEKMPISIHVVEFILGSEHFAIDLFDVKEVVEYAMIPKLPNVPAYVRGIIDLRGEITMIIDRKHRLNVTEESSKSLESLRIVVLDDKLAQPKNSRLN
jgi:purine-binding chemotaxis protein CheW